MAGKSNGHNFAFMVSLELWFPRVLSSKFDGCKVKHRNQTKVCSACSDVLNDQKLMGASLDKDVVLSTFFVSHLALKVSLPILV